MKADIHPNYTELKVNCNCGYKFITRSTMKKDSLHLDVCSNCHPFYTGEHKIIDTEGRVDKFMRRYASSKSNQEKPASDKEPSSDKE